MGFVKANVSEPLMKSRDHKDDVQTAEGVGLREQGVGAGLIAADMASGFEAARARIGLMHGTLEPVAAMPRETLKRGDRKSQRTDARHRGGATRSSDEAAVTGGERRGRVIESLANRPTALSGRSL